MRKCGACSNAQGPFDRVFVGPRRTGQWVFTCRIPVKDGQGRRLPDSKRREFALACLARRDNRG